MATRDLDIKEFAQRVERICDFFLAQISDEEGRDGSKDIAIIEDLKEDAADIQVGRAQIVKKTFAGLDNYMRGLEEST